MQATRSPKTTYLIIGNGRLSRHLQHYFSLLNIDFEVWHRSSLDSLDVAIETADRILLAIRDDALVDFVRCHPALLRKTTIHFSGAQNIEGVFSAHPLMSFGPDLYSEEAYRKIPVITVIGEPPLQDLLPELPNPTAAIPAEKKSLYHAYCVMSGNFTTLLWSKIFKDFAAHLELSPEILEPFLKQTVANILKNPEGSLTGPIARGDSQTIRRNLDALTGSPYQLLYYSFINFARETNQSRLEGNDEHPRI